mgnify:CR=1 FL=1
MGTINDRIAECVKVSGLTKTAFAERINVSQSFISNLCSSKKVPSDRTISDICREFGISEHWLRTGEGEMLVPLDDDVELIEIFAQIGQSEDDLIKRIIKGYWKLDEKEKAAIRKLIDSLCDK